MLLAAPFSRPEIARALDRLKVAPLLDGWRGRPAGDREALEALGRFAEAQGALEVEINPILVGQSGVLAVDAVVTLAARDAAVA